MGRIHSTVILRSQYSDGLTSTLTATDMDGLMVTEIKVMVVSILRSGLMETTVPIKWPMTLNTCNDCSTDTVPPTNTVLLFALTSMVSALPQLVEFAELFSVSKIQEREPKDGRH